MPTSTGRIVTLTANPSHDRTVALPGPLERGTVQRVDQMTSQAGGKGVNISRAAVAAGLSSVAVLPADPDDPFVRELEAAGIECDPTASAGPIRVNLTLTEPDGTTTKLNGPGAAVSAAHLDALVTALVEHAPDGFWTVLAGSLPPGAPTDFYADVVRKLHGHTHVAVDTSDAALGALIDGLPDTAPDLIKPNAEELASVTGHAPEDLEGDPELVAEAARGLVERGVGTVLATLGGRGAIVVDGSGAWHATPPPTTVVSTVGAGDSSLFGYLLGHHRGLPVAERLALAVAYGSAAAGLPGTTIPHPDAVRPDLVAVEAIALSTHP